jgi:DNA-binding transcriptional regulator GbsR (MarR family)
VRQVAEPKGEDAVRWFVERFALLLTDSGLPRMAARVFAYLVAGDGERYTVSQVAAGLGMSSAAVSGAVRQLSQAGLVVKDRVPGAAADCYAVYEDAWQVLVARNGAVIDRAVDVLAAGADQISQDTDSAGVGIREALEFFRFWRDELPGVMERWRRHRSVVLGDRTTTAGT